MSDTVYNSIPTLEQFQTMSEDELVAMTGYSPQALAGMRHTVESDAFFDANYPAHTPPCPSWCVYEAGHKYDSVLTDDHLTFTRFHSTTASGDVGITVEEHNKNGVVTFASPPFVDIWIGGNQADSDGSTADQAREYARQLLDAAEDLERIQRDQVTKVILDEQDAVAGVDRP